MPAFKPGEEIKLLREAARWADDIWELFVFVLEGWSRAKERQCNVYFCKSTDVFVNDFHIVRVADSHFLS